jgi:hypothetical protein
LRVVVAKKSQHSALIADDDVDDVIVWHRMYTVHALANMKSRRENSSEEDDWSPPADPLPIYQQRYNYLT